MPKNKSPVYDKEKENFKDPTVEAEYQNFLKHFTDRVEASPDPGPQLSADDKALLKGNAASQKLEEMANELAFKAGLRKDKSIKQGHHAGANQVINLVNEYLKIPKPLNADGLKQASNIEDKISASLRESSEKINSENSTQSNKRKISEAMHPGGTTRECIQIWTKVQGSDEWLNSDASKLKAEGTGYKPG